MNAPPDPSIVAKLEGRVVDTITFARYSLHFVCEDRGGFSISSPFCFGRTDQIAEMPWKEFPLSGGEIPGLLGSTILSSRTDDENHLRIEFSTGDLLVASWSAVYESYELQIDGERIIV